MNAVILAGGSGTRLRPLTLDRPAALLPVANRPIVEHLLEHLGRHRVSEVTFALHHCPYPLEAWLGDGTRWGLRLRYVLERSPLGTAGAARRIVARWTEPVLLAAGTALTTADLAKATTFHQLRGSALTLLVTPAETDAAEIDLDDEGCVMPTPSPDTVRCALTGLAIVEPAALALVPAGEPCDLVRDLVPRLLAAGQTVTGYLTDEPGLFVRTPEDLRVANLRAIAGDFSGLVLPGLEVQPGVFVSHGAMVHPAARLIPPVLVGANAVIGRGATIEATVVGEDVMVGAHSGVQSSVLLARTYVGRGLSLSRAIVDRDWLGQPGGGAWVSVRDPRILGDTRAPLRRSPGSLSGRGIAAALLLIGLPIWLPILAALALETRGRPFRTRPVVGARGGVARLLRVTVRGPVGRLLRRLGLTRAPHLWNVLRGDLHWVGTTPRSPSEWDALVARAELPLAPPGLVSLASLAPAPLRRSDRVALDRLYAATRSLRGNLRLLAAALLRRLGLPVRLSCP